MSSDEEDIWYRLGYALERMRDAPRAVPGLETLQRLGGASSRGRSPSGGGERRSGDDGDGNPGNAPARLLEKGARSAGNRLLAALPTRGRVRLLELLAAAVAGSAATVITEVAAALIRSEEGLSLDPNDLAVTLSGGVGRGLAYAGVVEPRVPGPAFVAGFVYGTAEYLTASWGGVPTLLGSASPHRKVPLLADLLEADDREEDPFLEHLVFGLALALLYDGLRPNRGITDDE